MHETSVFIQLHYYSALNAATEKNIVNKQW